jgi:hypothetical protein
MADSDDFYRSLLDQLSEGLYFVDRERRITAATRTCRSSGGGSRWYGSPGSSV